MIGFVWGIAAALLAAAGHHELALLCFVLNRTVDGLDGVVARRHGRVSDVGAYLDMAADMVVYVSIPLGVAFGEQRFGVWVATSLVLGSFAVNVVTWSYLSALLERRDRGAGTTGETTTVTMPPGLVEGFETAVWFGLLLAVPQLAVWWLGSMALAVTVGAAVRLVAGSKVLSSLEAEPEVDRARGVVVRDDQALR